MEIKELMDDIRKQDVVLPEFQREYVWTKDQAKQLMVSLLKEYPVGGLLFWKTDSPPDLKNVNALPQKLGTIRVILDGQQRLTTLYMLITGDIPAYYTAHDIQNDPRDLYYHLDAADFQYYQRSLMDGNPLWCRVVDCFLKPDGINVFRIAQQQARNDQEALQLAQRYNQNLNRVRHIREMDLPVQTVPSHATLDDAITIFDVVNSQGTKLTDAELALTHVTGKWSQARRTMKSALDDLAARHFYFDLTFMTRALTGVVTKRALFQTIHERPRKELEQGWSQLQKILDYIVAVLPKQAFVHSTEDLNTTNVLVPWVVFLSLNQAKFPSTSTLNQAVHWLYVAHIWSRYTAQTDQRLEHDVSLVVREANPWDALRDQIIDQRGRIEVKPNDMEGRGIQHPLYRMTYSLAKAHGALDWSTGMPLGTPHGKAYRVHSFHVFSQNLLYKNGYDPENHLHRKIINEIANRAFAATDNDANFNGRLPEEYLPEIEARYPGVLARQFIPIDPDLWRIERFTDFLEARRSMIAHKVNEFMQALISEPRVVHKVPVKQLITFGESATLEFKSTLQWDVLQHRQNKDLRLSVLKTIAAFLNTEGGTLVIGVEDDGSICGLRDDLKLVHGSRDVFQQTLANLTVQTIGPEFSAFIKLRFEDVDGEAVCVVDVDKAHGPAFVQGQQSKEFYVRLGNTTRALDPQETLHYIQMNWD